MNIEKRKTLTIFKKNQLTQYHQSGFNLIACGASRGGTSALGSLMKYFNFPMGENLHPSTHEDIDFANITIRGKMDELPELIRNKAKETANWSIKMPHALKHLATFDQNLDRCVFLIVVRNPFSVANSLIKHDNKYSNTLDEYLRGLDHAMDFYKKLHDLKGLKSPFIICEYEKALLSPRDFVLDFIYATGIESNEKSIQEAIDLISSSGYKEVNKTI